MYIFTDSPNSANRLFSGNHQWEKPDTEKYFNHDYEQLVSKLIKQPLFINIESKLGWHSLIHTQFSNQSQFDILNKMVKNNSKLPDGILCHADSGQNFHGQKNRSWETKEGNIHLSVFLTPDIFPEKMNSKFLTMGVTSVIKTMDSIPELKGKAIIKWPNDIYIGSTKVGGILTQCFTSKNNVRAVVIGIGLNVEVTPKISGDKFTPKAGCLKDHLKSVCFKTVFLNLLDSLYTHYQLVKNNKEKYLHDLYIKRSIILGKTVKIHFEENTTPCITGKVEIINDNLELIIKNNPIPVRNGRLEILKY